MARVLLLGGTGAIGTHLQDAALAQGHEVHVTSRRQRTSENARLVLHQGDALAEGFVDALVTQNAFDVIVDFMVYRTPEFARRIGMLLEACGQYVYLSSYRVFADGNGKPITEDSPKLLDVATDSSYLQTDEYALAKARQEAVLRGGSRGNWTIVRPSISYARNRLQLGCLEARAILPRAKANLPVVIPREMMERRTTMTYAGDVGRMIAALLARDGALGEDFNVLTGEPRTWRAIAEIYQSSVDMQVTDVSVDQYLSLGVNPYQLFYDRLFDRVCDNSKILSMLDCGPSALVTPEIGLSEAIAQSDVGRNTFSRLHGRMDALCDLNRVGQAPSPLKAAQYLAGRVGPVNAAIIRRNTRMFAPPKAA